MALSYDLKGIKVFMSIIALIGIKMVPQYHFDLIDRCSDIDGFQNKNIIKVQYFST